MIGAAEALLSPSLILPDGQLCLAAPTPIASRPTAHAHRPPVFRLDPVTSVLQVFSHMDDDEGGSLDTILEAVPQRADPAETSVASTQAVFGAISGFFGSFGGSSSSASHQQPSKALPPLPIDSGPLRSPTLDETGGGDDRDPEANEDSSTAPMRAIRTLCLPALSWREKLPAAVMGTGPWTGSAAERLWLRRQFDAIPVLVAGHNPPPPLPPPRIPSSSISVPPSSPPLPAPPTEADAVPIEQTALRPDDVDVPAPTTAAGSATGA